MRNTRNRSMFSSVQIELKDSWCWIHPALWAGMLWESCQLWIPYTDPQAWKSAGSAGLRAQNCGHFRDSCHGALEPCNPLRRCILTVNSFPDLVLVILTALNLLSSEFLFWITHLYMFLWKAFHNSCSVKYIRKMTIFLIYILKTWSAAKILNKITWFVA